MKIDNINMEDLIAIQYTYDNIDLLKIIHYFIGVVVNKINDLNSMKTDYKGNYNLGNKKYITSNDLDKLYSILDTINNIVDYNKDEVE